MKSKKSSTIEAVLLVLIIAASVGILFFQISAMKNQPIAQIKNEPALLIQRALLVASAPEGMRTGHFETPANLTGVLGYKSDNDRRRQSNRTQPVQIIPQTTSVNYNYGLSTGEMLPWMSDEDLGNTLNSFVSLGAGWIRMDLSWGSIQPDSATAYDWKNIDRVVSAANARNLKVLPILAYTPAWARPSGCNNDKCAPADPAKFAAFAAEAAKRYAPLGVHTWEIWNEPNISVFWQPAPDAKAYSNLLKLASAAIKAKDAQAKIITAGLSPADTSGTDISPIDFLTRIYQAGVASSFDAVGMHPYTYPFLATDANPWSAWLQMSVTKPNLRSVMTQNGDSAKQIWITEVGAPTGGPGLSAVTATNKYSGQYDHVSEALQAQIMSNAIGNYKTLSFAGPLFWYTNKDLGTANSTNENFFGLTRFDGSNKTAFDLFKSLISVK